MSRVSTGDRAIAAQTVALGIRALSIGVAYIALGKVIGTGFDTSVDVRWVVVGVGALVVAALCDFANGLSQATSAGSEEKRMRRALLAHAFGLGPARFSGHESGRLVSLMTDSVERVANYRQGYVGQLVGAILTPFITLVLIAIMIDWLTALILLACLPFVPLLIGVFQRRFRKDSARSRQVRGKLASQFRRGSARRRACRRRARSTPPARTSPSTSPIPFRAWRRLPATDTSRPASARWMTSPIAARPAASRAGAGMPCAHQPPRRSLWPR